MRSSGNSFYKQVPSVGCFLCLGRAQQRSNVLVVSQIGTVNVHLPKDRVTQAHQGYGFVEFATEEDTDYAIKILNVGWRG